MEEIGYDEVTAAIDRLVDELLDQAAIGQPPVNTLDLAARALGLQVYMDPGQRSRGRASRQRDRGVVFLRPESRPERLHWALAHEIGEHLKARIWQRLGVPPAERPALAGESLANLFARRLLVPTRWFRDDAPWCHYDLSELKERYRTASHEVIAWRMLDLPDPCIVTVVDNGHVTRRRSNAWPVTRQLLPVERACQHYVHEYSRPRRLQQGGHTVWGWPVHEPDWKREILRTVVEE
ncbi:MAG: hypothetical protein C4297_08095 [Gemmataceae bacterium]